MCLPCQAAILQNAMQCSFSAANPPLNPVTSDERKFVCGCVNVETSNSTSSSFFLYI